MNPTSRIYLDNNATTPLDPRVLAAMEIDATWPLNPSSTHFFGRHARGLLSQARATVAAAFDVPPEEIIFTSGGTESLQLLICGTLAYHHSGHIISSNLEHACVDATLKHCEEKGYEVTYLAPQAKGAPTPSSVAAAIRPTTRLIVLTAVNSETGVKLDIASIASLAQKARIPLILDGVALLGKEPVTLPPGVLGIGFSAHKIHGPQGVGFAIARTGLPLLPQLLGGGQEQGRRSGTENLAGILGLAKAISLLAEEGPPAYTRMAQLQTYFETTLAAHFPDLQINGSSPRIANTSNLAFPGYEGEVLLAQLDQRGIAASHGSACSSGALEPSRILLNMGYSRARAASSLRFSFSRMTTQKEIDTALAALKTLLIHLQPI